jgi:predicted DNA-binding transcriptional regulator YafY
VSRAQRLLELLQLLRRHRRAVAGAAIATELGISLRTLYRDIAALQAQGAQIDGAPGLGYVLREGFVLPPLMFTAEELEALALGSRWVAGRGDGRLAAAALDALAKIGAVLPAPLRHELDTTALLAGGGPVATPTVVDPGALRAAIRHEHKLQLRYRDLAGQDSERLVWPFALGYFDRVQVLVAWCELRQAMRHFRCDRILAAEPAGRYPRRRTALLQDWQAQRRDLDRDRR